VYEASKSIGDRYANISWKQTPQWHFGIRLWSLHCQACSHVQLSKLSSWDTTHHFHRLQQWRDCSVVRGSLPLLVETGSKTIHSRNCWCLKWTSINEWKCCQFALNKTLDLTVIWLENENDFDFNSFGKWFRFEIIYKMLIWIFI